MRIQERGKIQLGNHVQDEERQMSSGSQSRTDGAINNN